MPTDANAPQQLSWERIDAALREVLELDLAAQPAFLERLALSDPVLAARLTRLLAASNQVSALDSGELIVGFAQTALNVIGRNRTGQRLGAWELQDLIGSGGMAEVYLATRAIESGEQRAAIKLVHVPGADWGTESIVREAQVLARLSDPRIARLLDFGRTDAGEPWVAMEYVDGLPIDRWCAKQNASVRDRVRLMVNVAMAVDHAHRNLVVHRDIKPGNVFVSNLDGGLKLLDFGIARALPTPGREATRTALRAYTEAYASPEQLAGETVAVASDIYQLGGLLYLLLSETHPFADAPTNPAALLQAMEAGPSPPTRRARAGSESARRLARHSGVDLDTITLKAMEFRPDRRYLSAREFAEDLRHWLDGKAISARRGRLYRAGRMLRRHWGLAASLVLIGVLLAGYVANLRDRETLLEAQRLRTERVLDVAVELLNESDPYVAGASRDLADASMKRIRERVRAERDADPEFQSRILSLLAAVHGRRGQNRIGLEMAQEALAIATTSGLDETLVAEMALAAARTLQTLSRHDDALTVLDAHADALQRHAFVPSQSLRARIELLKGAPTQARDRLESVAAGLTLGKSLSPDERALLNQIAIVRGQQGDAAASIAAAEQAFAGFEPRSAREIASWVTYAMNLAVAYGDARRYREADALHRRVAEWARATLGGDHPQLAIIERSRATGLVRVARFREAYDIIEGAAPAAARQQLPLHRMAFLRARALTALYSGRSKQALADLIDADGIATRELGDMPNERARVLEDIAWTLFELGAYPEAGVVAHDVPRDAKPPARRAAMLRVLLPSLGIGSSDRETLPADRELVSSNRCTAIELEVIQARIGTTGSVAAVELPATCDGQNGALVHALGGRWSPDWLADFPLTNFESPLVARLRAGDLAARPLPAELQTILLAWREAQADSYPP